MSLRTISIPPRSGQAKGAVVVLHGWGANAQDVAALASLIDLPDYHFVFPDAPLPYAFSPVGRVWYNFPDNYSFMSRPEFYDQPELVQSRHALTEWIRSLPDSTGVPLDRTILGGFSQGGAMTLDVGLQLPLAALMVLSGYLHAPARLMQENRVQQERMPQEATKPLPVLLVHGIQDQVVPIAAAHQIRNSLAAFDIPVQYHELNMGHEIPPNVLSLMQSFIEETALSPDSPQKPL